MKYFKKLVGENIYLSPRHVDDEHLLTEWLNDFETTDYIGQSGRLFTLKAQRKYLEEDVLGESIKFAIIPLNEEKMIGSISLEKINNINRVATLMVYIGDKEYRSKGYGTEAVRLILDYGFNYLNLNNIELELVAFNERALNCYKKCGFKEYGRRRKCEFVNGKYYDRIFMDILAEEFQGNYIKNKNI